MAGVVGSGVTASDAQIGLRPPHLGTCCLGQCAGNPAARKRSMQPAQVQALSAPVLSLGRGGGSPGCS